MKKKIISLCLVVALGATAVIGGTLAYFTDTEKATNTMVIGNVEINIEEYAADGTPFVDDEFTMYPIEEVLGNELNNKVVKTFNTSPSEDAAYIRTFILFEQNDILPSDFLSKNGITCACPDGLHFEHSDDSKNLCWGSVTVDGEKYWAYEFVAADGQPIAYGESLDTLTSVYMDDHITSDLIAGWQTKDDEGNITDNKVSILVFSQGIQATGLNHAEAMEALGGSYQTLKAQNNAHYAYVENLFKDTTVNEAVINDLSN